MTYLPDTIIRSASQLGPRDVFVFGSNEAGRHGAGAAKAAHRLFGYPLGTGSGRVGRAYGIPTKDSRIRTLPLASIQTHVATFLEHAAASPQFRFIVTPLGCGLAGYDHADIAPMFAPVLDHTNALFHVKLPTRWISILREART